MARLTRITGMALGMVAFCALGAAAQTTATPTVYKLRPNSTYQHGCFPPCLCPLMEQAAVRGTFNLTLTSSDPLFEHYAVTDVNWVVNFDGSEVRITGSGTYRIGGEVAVQEQLSLDLTITGQGTQHLDSGLVGTINEFPAIDVTISINGQFCLDTVIHVSAAPVPISQILRQRLLNTSTYQHGCFGPCDCVSPIRPIGGTFGLVLLQQTPTLREWAVVNVNWLVPPGGALPAVPVTGYGLYRIYYPGPAIAQRLSLELVEDGNRQAHFDSGQIPGGNNFPRIDAEISIYMMQVCNDTVINVHSAPLPILRTPVVAPVGGGG